MTSLALLQTPDLINCGFELIGAYFTWRNAWQLVQDREIKGVYWPTSVFFTIWGLWNVLYYPAIEQYASFAGGVVLVTGNLAWSFMAISIAIENNDKEQAQWPQ